MKKTEIWLACVLGLALPAIAAPPTPLVKPPTPVPSKPLTQNPSATKATKEIAAIPGLQPKPQPGPQQTGRIERVGNMSSEPWTKIVGWHPGRTQFTDAENHESQLVLVSVSFPHWHVQQPAISARSPRR